MTLVAGKRRRLFVTGDADEVFMTRSLNVTPKTTEQHLIVRSDKSKAEVIIIIKECARGITLMKITIVGHKASRGFSVTAVLLVIVSLVVQMSMILGIR